MSCVINPFKVDLHPLIVHSNTTDWIYPDLGETVLRFPVGTSLDFLCPGRNVRINTTSTGKAILAGTCISGSTFSINGTQVDWSWLSCSNYHWRSIINTGRSCASNGIELEIGFEISDGRFLTSLMVCFNPDQQIAYYTFINQTAAINQGVSTSNSNSPLFLQGSDIYTIGSASSYYNQTVQRATINTLLGLDNSSTKYIKDSGNNFLSRGHMIARRDGFYEAQQNATYYMQNIAPQWQTFNGFNWNDLETNLRDYTEASGADLQFWCGVHGVTTLPHETTGEEVELYLFVNDTMKALPVPEVYWKVVYNPLTEEGVAVIGHNNPYNSEYTPICDDISSNLSWFTCQSSKERGFCYACSIADFRKTVTVLPEFPSKSSGGLPVLVSTLMLLVVSFSIMQSLNMYCLFY